MREEQRSEHYQAEYSALAVRERPQDQELCGAYRMEGPGLIHRCTLTLCKAAGPWASLRVGATGRVCRPLGRGASSGREGGSQSPMSDLRGKAPSRSPGL